MKIPNAIKISYHIDIDQLHEDDELVSNNYNYPQLYKAYFEALGNLLKIINKNSKYIVDKILKNELYCDLIKYGGLIQKSFISEEIKRRLCFI